MDNDAVTYLTYMRYLDQMYASDLTVFVDVLSVQNMLWTLMVLSLA